MNTIQKLYINQFKKLFDSKNFEIFLKNNFKFTTIEQKSIIQELILLYKKNEINNFEFCQKDDFFHPFLSIYLNDKKNFLFHYKINIQRIEQFIKEQNILIEQNKKNMENTQFIKENMQNHLFESFFGSIFGAIIGDSVGAVLEFQERFFPDLITDMSSGGNHNISKGEWTDDSSMMLCLMQSLIDKDFDLHDQINNYLKWYKNGFLSTRNVCFDIGISTRNALDHYYVFNDFKDTNKEHLSGNGSIMRLAPVPLYYKDYQTALTNSVLSSTTTHQSDLCLDGCLLLSAIIHLITHKQLKDKNEILFSEEIKLLSFKTRKFIDLISFDFLKLKYEEIPNSGFVVDTLISAIWCFYHTDNYKDSILKAANLCGDADTIACVCGQISGAFYGFSAIEQDWLNHLHSYDLIFDMTKALYVKSLKNN